jgi:hypothetical protein
MLDDLQQAVQIVYLQTFQPAVVLKQKPPLFRAPTTILIGRRDDGQKRGGVLHALLKFYCPFGSWAQITAILPNGHRIAISFVELLAECLLEEFHPVCVSVRVTQK